MREQGWPENDQNNFPGAQNSDAQTDLIANAKGTAYLNYGEPRKRRSTILDPENCEKNRSSVANVQKILKVVSPFRSSAHHLDQARTV